ncbi:MAG TPA: hypothetical protein VER17_20085 [Tepidisphaeraceae bacterium]|nr:hypothetical protein [Tepidisphaeraceae bacterium]
MRSRRLTLMVLGLTVLGISAGVLAGLLAARLPAARGNAPVAPPAPAAGGVPAGLVEELALTPKQEQLMREVWEGVRTRVHRSYDEAQDLQQQRDRDIAALMSDEQKAKFEQLTRDYAGRYEKLEQRRREAFDKAVERTRSLLDEGQRAKYDKILESRVKRSPPTTMMSPPAASPASPAPAGD